MTDFPQLHNHDRLLLNPTGIAASQLCRLMSGERSVTLRTAEALCDYLELEITIKPKRRRKDRK